MSIWSGREPMTLQSDVAPLRRVLLKHARDEIGTVRLSVGWQTSKDEVERAASLLLNAWEDLRG